MLETPSRGTLCLLPVVGLCFHSSVLPVRPNGICAKMLALGSKSWYGYGHTYPPFLASWGILHERKAQGTSDTCLMAWLKWQRSVRNVIERMGAINAQPCKSVRSMLESLDTAEGAAQTTFLSRDADVKSGSTSV